MADVKGDLAGISQPGSDQNQRVMDRLKLLKIENHPFEGCPVEFWDVFGEQGHPLRATVAEMGPLLLSRILNLNDVQAGVLHVIFRVADDNGWLLLDLKDLRAMAQYVGDNAKQFTVQYGNIATASIGAIQRGLLELETQGGDQFFGEPALDLFDLIQTDSKGRGVVNILAADKLLQAPKLYATFLLWMLSELFENLPEVGDLEKPKLVFFFDEAHLLFDDAPKELLDKVEQVVRIIRSKGVGVYFVTQNPIDIPDTILGQMGNRVQHALRAFTPKDQKAVAAMAETFRPNPKLKIEDVVLELGVGEALISFLDAKGQPEIVERGFVIPPNSQIGPITPSQRQSMRDASPIGNHYLQDIDRESAYEILTQHASQAAEAQAQIDAAQQAQKQAQMEAREQRNRPKTMGEQILTGVVRSMTTAIGATIGRNIVRGVLGGILGGLTGGRRRR
jgi:DNA helicase HerA-like ATPase